MRASGLTSKRDRPPGSVLEGLCIEPRSHCPLKYRSDPSVRDRWYGHGRTGDDCRIHTLAPPTRCETSGNPFFDFECDVFTIQATLINIVTYAL